MATKTGAKPKNLKLRRKAMNPREVFKAGHVNTFNIDEAYIDVILVPAQGGPAEFIDTSDAAKGIVKIRFEQAINRLTAILYTVE